MISVNNLSKTYTTPRGDLHALEKVSFEVGQGELVTVFGPNGSGKSTLFNIIAGLESFSEGTVSFGGKSHGEVNMGFVFQNYNESMFPWLTVLDNVLFPLDVQKVSRDISLPNAEHILGKVRLWEHRNKYLYELSGGMRQLVAISRAFISDPEFLLMDEPCSALDYATTKRVGMELLSLWQERKITTVVVSHDIDEAIFLADKVFVMSPRPGKLKEVIPVDLPRPRTMDMFASKEFFEIRSRVLKSFMYE
jgi:NitT/TauT family transport system ATP-binding protein